MITTMCIIWLGGKNGRQLYPNKSSKLWLKDHVWFSQKPNSFQMISNALSHLILTILQGKDFHNPHITNGEAELT